MHGLVHCFSCFHCLEIKHWEFSDILHVLNIADNLIWQHRSRLFWTHLLGFQPRQEKGFTAHNVSIRHVPFLTYVRAVINSNQNKEHCQLSPEGYPRLRYSFPVLCQFLYNSTYISIIENKMVQSICAINPCKHWRYLLLCRTRLFISCTHLHNAKVVSL